MKECSFTSSSFLSLGKTEVYLRSESQFQSTSFALQIIFAVHIMDVTVFHFLTAVILSRRRRQPNHCLQRCSLNFDKQYAVAKRRLEMTKARGLLDLKTTLQKLQTVVQAVNTKTCYSAMVSNLTVFPCLPLSRTQLFPHISCFYYLPLFLVLSSCSIFAIPYHPLHQCFRQT